VGSRACRGHATSSIGSSDVPVNPIRVGLSCLILLEEPVSRVPPRRWKRARSLCEPTRPGVPSWQLVSMARRDVGVPIDANGNLTSDGTRTFEWDARNQLVAVTVGTHRTEFDYNG